MRPLTDEEHLTELRRVEARGKRLLFIASWLPAGIAVAIACYFIWYIGELRGEINGLHKCLDELDLPKKAPGVRH